MSLNESKGILIITDVYKMIAGSEKNITQLLTQIDKKKFQFYVACFVDGDLAEEMRGKGYPIYKLYGAGVHTLRGLKNLSFLRNVVREKNISLIVTYHEASDFYGLIVSKLCNIPIISNRRDMGFKADFHHRIIYRAFGKCFNAVITVSHAVEREVVTRGWFPSKKIFTIYNGVKLEDYENGAKERDTKRKMGISVDRPVVGMIANLRRIKGIYPFIEAASIIHHQGSEIEFLIAGDDLGELGCTRKDLESFVKNLCMEQSIHFLGKRTDIPDLISTFDVAVVPSLSEGFSNVVLEYMAAAKPLVATLVGGNGEVVKHGETGLLVPPGDPSALAEAIVTILKDKELALNLGTEGRRQVHEKFTRENMTSNYERVFEQVINNKHN